MRRCPLADRLERDQEASLLALIRLGGDGERHALEELCRRIRPFVSALARGAAARYPALDCDDIEQLLWVQAISLARSHDPSRSRLLHMIRIYGLPNAMREACYAAQRAPVAKYRPATWWHEAEDVDQIANL